MIKRPYRTMLLSATALSLTALLLRFPPDSYNFYPRCPIFALTGLRCPGCGGTRAMAALLGGRWVEAMQQNALVVPLLPFLAVYLFLNDQRTGERGKLCWRPPSRWIVSGVLAAAAIFTAARDLPQ